MYVRPWREKSANSSMRVSDVHHGDERRIVLGGRQVAHVKLGLALGLVHRGIPARRPSHGRPAPRLLLRGQRKCLGLRDLVAPLLGLQYEAVALVEVDPLDGGRSVRVREWHRAFEHVSVLLVVGPGRVGPGDFEEIAQLVQEHRVVGSFRGARGFPAPEELVQRRGNDSRIGHDIWFRRWITCTELSLSAKHH